MIIAGDGYAYTAYLTESEIGDEKQSATQPQPLAAYPIYDQLVQDTTNSNFSAALSDLDQLSALVAINFDPLRNDLQNSDRLDALNLLNFSYGPDFVRHCDSSSTDTYSLHVLRVGSDGSASDVSVEQWNESRSTVYAPTPGDAFNFTSTQQGPTVGVDSVQMITNADTGAVISWRWSQQGYCALSTDSGCSAWVGATREYHLTTMAGGGVASDVVWNPVAPGQYQAVQPILQLADGSFVGKAHGAGGNVTVAFDSSGNVKWIGAGANVDMATADGGIITDDGNTTYTTLDGSGNITGTLGTSNVYTYSWLGNAYHSGSVEQVAAFAINYAPTFAAIAAGNTSANGTAIWQVLSPVIPSGTLQKQLPPSGANLNWNYNSIELLTTASADTIFANYIQSFAGAGVPGVQGVNHEVSIINTPPPPVTGIGQNITFILNNWAASIPRPFGCGLPSLPCTLQGPFSVQTERFDTTAHTISAVTLTGHPLEGWRYWRVFSNGTNDIVVEIGAADLPFPGPVNWAGYYIYPGKSFQLKTWEEDLRYILKDVRNRFDSNAVEGTNPQWNVVKGAWNPQWPTKDYILNNVCQSSTCN